MSIIKFNLDLQPSSWRLRSADKLNDKFTCCIYDSGLVYSTWCVHYNHDEYSIMPVCII